MVWDCMSASGTGILAFFDTIMTKEVYFNILKTKCPASTLGMPSVNYFQQNNVPKQYWTHIKILAPLQCFKAA